MNVGLFIFLSALTVSVPNGQQQIVQAYYRQSGLDKPVRQVEQNVTSRLSDNTKFYVGNAAFITKVLVEQKIELKWRFP